MQKVVYFIIFLLLVYVAYQAKWFDGAIEYFTELSKQQAQNTVIYDEYGNETIIEHKSIIERLKDMRESTK